MNTGFRTASGLEKGGNLTFQRGADGSVVITAAPDHCPTPDHVKVVGIIDKDSWASAIAHVGAVGDPASAFSLAQDLHGSR